MAPTAASAMPRRPAVPATETPADTLPAQTTDGLDVPETGRRLIVGRDISLSGAINACDHLVVEGRIEATLDTCETIKIADGGVFRGKATVITAEIAGRVEGELIVTGRLIVRGTGIVNGDLRYGSLVVEEGGRLVGSLEPIEPGDGEPG